MFAYTTGHHTVSRKGYDFLNLPPQSTNNPCVVCGGRKVYGEFLRLSVSYDREAPKGADVIRGLLSKGLAELVRAGKAQIQQIIAVERGLDALSSLAIKMWWPPRADTRPNATPGSYRTWGKICGVKTTVYPPGVDGLDMIVGNMDPRLSPDAQLNGVWVFDGREVGEEDAIQIIRMAVFIEMVTTYWDGKEGQEMLNRCVQHFQKKMLIV